MKNLVKIFLIIALWVGMYCCAGAQVFKGCKCVSPLEKIVGMEISMHPVKGADYEVVIAPTTFQIGTYHRSLGFAISPFDTLPGTVSWRAQLTDRKGPVGPQSVILRRDYTGHTVFHFLPVDVRVYCPTKNLPVIARRSKDQR